MDTCTWILTTPTLQHPTNHPKREHPKKQGTKNQNPPKALPNLGRHQKEMKLNSFSSPDPCIASSASGLNPGPFVLINARGRMLAGLAPTSRHLTSITVVPRLCVMNCCRSPYSHVFAKI
ncbi:hypothetical protein TRIATDRAFT_298429 [Trichoderma atroviride IMI 206040]|uniref:Uncharacterized protein n=1 Tax=Hypocrea atroviridis (strain ATCC 20476 / IMI 206040) TaxID=452589 RepID=G9NN06_HYPAI|nr:uncharacterized protein TRIATDRAFT_298429 [Trichoderma atroviride IMI 206040]EHK48285.1 hypothetical protein TRIATDRAFT_298429 [Trichoderma atroviride IMI 206040]